MANTKWVAGWGASISVVAQNHAEYIKDQTFRYVIFPTMDGEALRLHLSNQYGSESVTVDKIYVARRTEGEYVDVSQTFALPLVARIALLSPQARLS